MVKESVIKKVNNILYGLTDISDCGAAGKVIDFFEKDFPNEKFIIKEFRDYLCDKSFELFISKYKK
jgi:hypothetical protein|tara:strand:- start:521 stop:718 length:198 start_codon:yes stop_codon:yes gene_type:complete